MKVLHIVHWPKSGIGVVLRDLSQHRSPDIRHAVFCLARGRPVTDQIRKTGATVLEPDRAVRSWFEGLMRLRRTMAEERPDVINSHSLTPRILAGLSAPAIPHVTTVHAAYMYMRGTSFRHRVKRFLECLAAHAVDGPYICVAEDVARGLPCSRLTNRAQVITNGIDIEATREAAGGAGAEVVGNPLLVAIGRLDPEKAFDRLLLAIQRIRPHFPGIRLVICGDGRQRDVLESMSSELGLHETVTFTGHLENPMPVLRKADAFVSSSVQEGFALSVAEAMILGCPVISTPVSGVASMLTNESTAIVASGFTIDDIASALMKGLSNRKRLHDVAEDGRRYAETHFDVRRTVRQYEAVYRGMCQSTNA